MSVLNTSIWSTEVKEEQCCTLDRGLRRKILLL